MSSIQTDDTDDDLYLTLNVSRTSTAADLKKSYRKLSQRYHPDKHVDDSAKVAASDHFTKVKEAYEILSDDKLRKLYDEFGLSAARKAATQEMEMVSYSDLAERFRNDASGTPGGGGGRAPRDAYFTVVNSVEPRVDATGLVIALQEGEYVRGEGVAVVSQVSLSTMATAYVSQNNTIAARYALRGQGIGRGQRYGGGVGDLVLSFRREIDAYMHAEATAYLPLDDGQGPSGGFKLFRALSNDTTGSFEATYDPLRRDLTTALTSARSFSERCTASTSWAFGASPGYAFTWRRSAYDEFVGEGKHGSQMENDQYGHTEQESPVEGGRVRRILERLQCLIEPIGLKWNVRLNGMAGSMGLVLRRPIGRNAPLWTKCSPTGPGGAHVKIRAQVGAMGWEVEMGGGRRYVLADTAWGTSVAFGTVGVVWRLKLSRSGHALSLPVVLVSSTCDAKTATIAAMSTSLLVSAIQFLIVSPWRERKEKQEREDAKSRRADVLAQGKSDAEAAVQLMRQTVERCRNHEKEVVVDGKAESGLLIERAVYGSHHTVSRMTFSDGSLVGREIEAEAVDVTDCVQAMVEDSTVQVVSGTKSTLMGFWDPSAFGDKEELVLRIWYRFRREPHECLIRDNEPIELPLSSHRVQSWT